MAARVAADCEAPMGIADAIQECCLLSMVQGLCARHRRRQFSKSHRTLPQVLNQILGGSFQNGKLIQQEVGKVAVVRLRVRKSQVV